MLNKIIQNLSKLEPHFTKCPDRVYSKEKLEEKNHILRELIKNFEDNIDLLQKGVEKDQILKKFNNLTSNIEIHIKNQQIKLKLTMNKVEFLKVASSTLHQSFSGDPLKLNSFIDSVNLLDSIAEGADLKALLVTFIKTKIDGRARESLNPNSKTIQDILKDLKDNIKPENSKVIEGKFVALRSDRISLSDFSERANELAEALNRALVIEGITPH